MSIVDFLFDDPKTPEEALVDRALKKHFALKQTEKFADWLVGSEDEDLERESRKLDIAMKRRALSLPYTTDDLEYATNEGLPFKEKGVLAAFGVRASELTPDPSFMRPDSTSPIKDGKFLSKPKLPDSPLKAIFKIGHAVDDTTPAVSILRRAIFRR